VKAAERSEGAIESVSAPKDSRISFDDTASVTLVGFADPHALHVTDFLFA